MMFTRMLDAGDSFPSMAGRFRASDKGLRGLFVFRNLIGAEDYSRWGGGGQGEDGEEEGEEGKGGK